MSFNAVLHIMEAPFLQKAGALQFVVKMLN